MKIAVYNIFFTVCVLFILGLGCFLSYQGVFHIDNKMDLVGLFFLIIFVLLTVGGFLYVVFYFRVVVVFRSTITCYTHFGRKKTSIAFDSIKKINWGYFEKKAVYYLRLEIIGLDGSIITLSDFEFENFKSIAKSVFQNTRYKIPQQLLLDQAKANKTQIIWAFVMITLLLVFVFYNSHGREFDWVLTAMTFALFLLLFATVRRLIRYYRI